MSEDSKLLMEKLSVRFEKEPWKWHNSSSYFQSGQIGNTDINKTSLVRRTDWAVQIASRDLLWDLKDWEVGS